MPIHYRHLDELTVDYGHIVLSPHLDDAALSCGGRIAALVAAGEAVLVVNICSGSLAPGTALSPFAEENHVRWGLPAAEAVALRLAEDECALEILGADSLQLDQLDAIYRMPGAYVDEATLFGAVAPDDPLPAAVAASLADLATRFPDALFYAPLGVGRHVDHQATYAAAAALAATLAATNISVAFYEDFPYVTVADALKSRLDELGGSAHFMPLVSAIDATLTRKVGAIESYTSQVDTLFGSVAAVAGVVGVYAASLAPDGSAYGERLWARI
jgi:LmbE family N-acetylglucosaminyl deacetylase